MNPIDSHRLLLLLALLFQFCPRELSLPPDPPDPVDTIDTGDTDTEETGDTGPAPPCPVMELEPNDTIQEANELAMERRGCGQFDAPNDSDFWGFDLPDDGWLGIRVDAQSIGSAADVQVTVSSDVGVSAIRIDNEEHNDVDMLFPAFMGRYELRLLEESAQGGEERYYYEVLVSQAKEPVEYDLLDPGTNTEVGEALRLAPGDRVLGTFDNVFAPNDWYAIEIPADKHTLTLSIDAYRTGSPADLSMWLYDEDLEFLPQGCRQCEITGGLGSGSVDPYFEYESPGNETVFIQLQNTLGGAGPAHWYLLTIELEEA